MCRVLGCVHDEGAELEAFCYPPPGRRVRRSFLPPSAPALSWCRPDCLTICGHDPVMPRERVHVTDPTRTVSARQQASLTLRIPLRSQPGFPEQGRFSQQVTLLCHLQLME